MAYTKTTWVNNTEPSINADNLNKIEQGIYDAQFPSGGETGKVLTKNSSTDNDVKWDDVKWGDIAGTLTNQTDLVTALGTKVNTSSVGTANGIAELDASGKVPSSQLPSYVDDVVEYNSISDFPVEGEVGKIYVAKDTNLTYRWSGSEYVEISQSLALGETSATAYRGDRGKTAYDHSQTVLGNPHNVTKTDVGLGNVDNTSDTDKPVSTATQTALDAKSNLANIAVVESGTTASQAYTVGKFVCVSGNLYKVITPIAQGDTFTVGTNISTDTIGAELSELNTGLSSAVKSVNTETPDANGNVNITKANIGLGNVDNTSDLDKPISTATQTALANQKYFYIDSEGYGCINYDLFQTA